MTEVEAITDPRFLSEPTSSSPIVNLAIVYLGEEIFAKGQILFYLVDYDLQKDCIFQNWTVTSLQEKTDFSSVEVQWV